MTFDYAIPKAKYIDDPIPLRGVNGEIIPRLKKVRVIGKRGDRNRRHIRVVVDGGYEHTYHATRGWKKRKV